MFSWLGQSHRQLLPEGVGGSIEANASSKRGFSIKGDGVPLTPNSDNKSAVMVLQNGRVPRADTRHRPRESHERSFVLGLLERFYKTAMGLVLTLWWLPIFVIVTSRAARRALLAIAVINISFQVEKHFFLREDAANLGSLGGLQVSLTNIALTLLCVAWVIGAITSPPTLLPTQRTKTFVLIPASLLLMFYVISLFVAGDVRLALFQVCSVGVFFCLFLYVAETVNTRGDVLFVVRALLVGSIIQSCLMFAQARGLVGEIQFYFIRTQAGTFRDGRVIGTLGSPNMAAAYLAMMMLLALGIILGNARRADKCLASIGFVFAVIALIFTESRGGWTSLLLGLVTMMIFGGRRVASRIAGGIVVLIVLLAIPLKDVIVKRLSDDDNGSAVSRIALSQIALLMIEDHPISGVGANNYALFMTPYAARSGRIGEFRYTVHNTYFLTCAEIGIGGLIALVWLLISIVRQGIRCSRFCDPLCGPLALGCAAAVVGFMFQLGVDIFRTGSAMDLMWLFGGLVTAMSRISLDRSRVPMYNPLIGRKPIEYDFERLHPVAEVGRS